MEKGKANRTVYPDGTIGVYFRLNEKVYEKFTEKCEQNGYKKKFKLEELIKKFTK